MRKILFYVVFLTPLLPAQPQAGPPRTFASQCSTCHGADASGTDRAPSILPFVSSHSNQELTTLVRTGRVDKGMPKFDWTDSEIQALNDFLRGLSTPRAAAGGGGG